VILRVMRQPHDRLSSRFVQVFAFALCLALGACGSQSGSKALRIGTSGDYPPLTSAEGGKLEGVEIDFANALAESSGRAIELVQIPFVELIPALVAGRIDVIMSGMSVTPERSEQVQFVKPYLQVGQMALIRSAEIDQRSQREQVDVAGTRIGFRPGTTGEQFLRERAKAAELVPVTSIEDGVQALRDERIDYFVHDAPTIWRIVGGFESGETELTGLYRPLTEEYLAWAVRKDDAELAGLLDETLAEWRADGRLETVLNTWIRVRRIQVD
jgi:ABC-type amino acid transport substrate-binding protein